MISYDSTLAITVTKKNDMEYYVKMYDLKSYEMTFEEKIGTPDDSCYIKLKEVEQRDCGRFFAIAYYNNGFFKLRTFAATNRSADEIASSELDINKELGIDDYTMPVDNFADPFITCTFIDDQHLFVNLYHSASCVAHTFVYNYETKVVSSHQAIKMQSNTQNFPYKCFYSAEENEVYSFFRQGQAFRFPIQEVPSKKNEGKDDYMLEQIIDKDLGQMYLINEKALIARSSSQILFFKQETDPFTFEKSWQCYKTLNIRGFIYFIKGNKRIQITTDKKIYVYLIDPVTFEPELENVINNFMNCTTMMFGSKVKYGITFKTN